MMSGLIASIPPSVEMEDGNSESVDDMSKTPSRSQAGASAVRENRARSRWSFIF